MTERQNTVVCVFDRHSPKISAYEIHEWIYDTLRLPDDDIEMIQIDGPNRHVYIKFVTQDKLASQLATITGTREYMHVNGEISKVEISPTGLGYREIRIAGLPPEVQDSVISATLTKYGDIREIQREVWKKQYRYKVSNGIRLVNMLLKRHIPSQVLIAGTKTLITYTGQVTTCFTCNEQGHHAQMCPHRRTSLPLKLRETTEGQTNTWASRLQNTLDNGVGTADSQMGPEPPQPSSMADVVNKTEQVRTDIGHDDHLRTTPTHPEVRNHNSGDTDKRNNQHSTDGENMQQSQLEAMETVQAVCLTDSDMTDTGDEIEEATPLANRKTRSSQSRKERKKKRNRRPVANMDEQQDTHTDNQETGSDTLYASLSTSPKRTKKMRPDQGESQQPDRTRDKNSPQH
jgi:hypothetical protein